MAASAAYKKRKQSQGGHVAEGSQDRLGNKSMPTEHLVAAVNMMRLSGYQSDPLAAAMNTRSMGLSKLNISTKQ